MENQTRTVFYDKELELEAYSFKGVSQSFSKHFHDYYVIGFVDEGSRDMECEKQSFRISKGDILLFNPGDKHSCLQNDGGTFDYRAFNIKPSKMNGLYREITGKSGGLRFQINVISSGELYSCLSGLHDLIMSGSEVLEKEELLLYAMGQLFDECGEPWENNGAEENTDIGKACEYINAHFSEKITLDCLCRETAMSRAGLLRCFAAHKGISPYRYLENIRLGKAKELLENGVSPVETAMSTGFSDQSHFTNFFKSCIGLTPSRYSKIFGVTAHEK